MLNFPSLGALSLLGALLAGPVLAQQAPADNAPATPNAAATEQSPAGIAGQASTKGEHLVVAAVKPKDGWRASKVIGSAVYNDQNQKIGSIDDLIVSPDSKVSLAVISVGGFLGIGSKLVAVPYDRLHRETTKDNGERLQFPGANKDALNAMPTFTYGNS